MHLICAQENASKLDGTLGGGASGVNTRPFGRVFMGWLYEHMFPFWLLLEYVFFCVV